MASPDLAVMVKILELARWAPSGDNTQPWRFEIVSADHVVVHGHDTRDHCVYDLDGRASQMSLGALIETVAIAASAYGLHVQDSLRPDSAVGRPTFDLHLTADPALQPDPLHDFVTQRSVQRRPFTTVPLSSDEKAALEVAVGATGHRVQWIESAWKRLEMARLLFSSAWLRLVTPEAYRVHREVIEWGAQHSIDRIPDQALGVDRLMLATMRHVLQSWDRVEFFNRFLAGTWMPRLQMDFLPALACGAHFVISAPTEALQLEAHVMAGRALQRFWLTATRLGLMVQPELTPLVFARYAAEGRQFSVKSSAVQVATRVASRMLRVLGPEVVSKGVFLGRIGHAPAPRARSLRLELPALRSNSAKAGSSARR